MLRRCGLFVGQGTSGWSLVGRPSILEFEGHGSTAIRTERRDERRLDLVILLEGYLVIVDVTVKEGE